MHPLNFVSRRALAVVFAPARLWQAVGFLVLSASFATGLRAQDLTKDFSSWPVNEPEYVALLCGETITGPMDYADLLYQAIRQQIEEARVKRGVVLSEKEAFELIRRRTCPTPELQPRKRAR